MRVLAPAATSCLLETPLIGEASAAGRHKPRPMDYSAWIWRAVG